MSIALFLKNNLKNIPPGLGKAINFIPYSIRPGLGKIYRERRQEIIRYAGYSDSQKAEFIFSKIKPLVEHAFANIPFYKEHYSKNGFNPRDLKSFQDIQKIPLVDKALLNGYSLEQRSCPRPGRYIVNTGGSSGTPFSFYIEPSSMGHEWAHMHHIWERLGYKPSDLKIVFGGRSDVKDLVDYDVVRNHFAIDIYAEYDLVSEKLKKILRRYSIKYLHGYPSSIYDFAIYCKNNHPELQELLSRNLKGVFLGSEYPHEHYRKAIEETFDVKTISWYGHTERAVLAFERKEKFTYEPFGTYGFAEAISLGEDNYQLIGTSYYNYATPLIRYNTNDIISDIELEGGILHSFKVTKGREGEFILDNSNKRINLTGLIFGRHHELFNYSKFLQVKQLRPGEIEIHFVSPSLSVERARDLFDSKNLDLTISFVKQEEPIRSLSGKINLLIK